MSADRAERRVLATAETNVVRDAARKHRPAVHRAAREMFRVQGAAVAEAEAQGARQAVKAAEGATDDAQASFNAALKATLDSAGAGVLRLAKRRGTFKRPSRARRRAAALSAATARTLADGIEMGAFNKSSERAVAWAERRAAELVTEVDDGTREGIAELVSWSLDGGATVDGLAKEIEPYIGLRTDQVDRLVARADEGASRSELVDFANEMLEQRADLIARTETGRAASAGQRETWLQAIDAGDLARDEQRVWIGTDDGRERDEHVECNDQVVRVDEPFVVPSTGRELEPGEDPNCRCSMGIALPEDVADAADEEAA